MNLASILIYPVKSLPGIELETVEVTAGLPMPHDRCFAFARSASTFAPPGEKGWSLSGWKKKAFFLCLARDAFLGRADSTTLQELLNTEEQKSETLRKIKEETSTLAGKDTVLLEAEKGATLHDFPEPYWSLGNRASLRALEKELGQTIEKARFRLNLWLEDMEPFAEQLHVGQKLVLQGVEFEVVEPIERCQAISLIPGSDQRDDLMQKLLKSRHENRFGVYLRALTSGPLKREAAARPGGPK